MSHPRRAALGVVVLALVPATAFGGDYQPIRSLGTGGAMRGVATGDTGPMLNPSGMPLVRTYGVEAAYVYGNTDSSHAAHAAIVDSTSAFNLSGGLTYTFFHASPDAPATTPPTDLDRTGHEVRLALAFPFGDKVFVGATGKYLNVSKPEKDSDWTVDAGLTIRPAQIVSVGLVGYNLRESKGPDRLRSFGYGVAVMPWPDFVLVLDGVTTFATAATSDETKTSIMGGGEVLFGKSIAVRLGGGRDGVRDRTYLGAGLSLVSEDGAIDFGARQDLSGDPKTTYAGISLRLFIPQP